MRRIGFSVSPMREDLIEPFTFLLENKFFAFKYCSKCVEYGKVLLYRPPCFSFRTRRNFEIEDQFFASFCIHVEHLSFCSLLKRLLSFLRRFVWRRTSIFQRPKRQTVIHFVVRKMKIIWMCSSKTASIARCPLFIDDTLKTTFSFIFSLYFS